MLLVATLVAYHNSFIVPFVFDDIPAIVENPLVHHFSLGEAMVGSEQTGGLTTSGRPVVALSFALNHALGGDAVWGYHAINLAIHFAAGLCLLGIVRRALLLPALRERFEDVALPMGFLVAAIWTLHPLQTESVTYVVQRAESLAGLFCLLTLYAFIRVLDAERPAVWKITATTACVLGMASKESVVATPLIVLVFDRTFVSATFRTAWKHRAGLHLALGAAWIVLAFLVIGTRGRGGTAGFATLISPWSYALTQCRAILHYLWLVAWPDRLVFDYGLGTAKNLAAVFPQVAAIAGLIALTVTALRRWPTAGFIGFCFFALLAPSSSVVPVVTQTAAEHRMYLPLAGVVAGVVFTIFHWTGRRTIWVGAVAVLALGATTIARNHAYRSEAAIWADTVANLPTNARAHNNLGQALFRAGKIPDAVACYEKALALQPDYPESHYNLGVALVALNRAGEGIEHYEAALRLRPAYPEAHNNLGNALVKSGRIAEALPHYERAIALRPGFAEAHNNLGNALLQSGKTEEAMLHFQRALELRPEYPEALYNLGNARARGGAMTDALALYERALKLKPDYAEAHVNAGNALLSLGRAAEALPHYEKAVALTPGLADAHYNLAAALLELGRWSEAIPPLETVLRLNPAFARAHHGLGFALLKTGRLNEAVSQYESYLRVMPDDAEAREELRQLRASLR